MAKSFNVDGIKYVPEGQVSSNWGRAPFNNNNGYPKQPNKRSGAKFQVLEGANIVSAWRVQKGQMFSLYARPYKKTKRIESKNGKEWVNLFVTITNRSTLQVAKTSGLLDVQGKRLYIKEFNLIVTKGGRGGYFGRHLGAIKNR